MTIPLKSLWEYREEGRGTRKRHKNIQEKKGLVECELKETMGEQYSTCQQTQTALTESN